MGTTPTPATGPTRAPISTTERSVSNAVCLWQTILWANHATEIDSTYFDLGDVDGHFGANTKRAATGYSRNGLADSWGEADGRVGPNTFGKADDRLVKGGGSTDPRQGAVPQLQQRPGYFHLYRSTSGIYWFQIGHGSTWHGTSYASRNNRLRLTGRFTQERDVCTGSPERAARRELLAWLER
ncbi:peptidoglycan-binding protein [Streptomyces sp. KL116D]|uniref:peptidoglycan-binding domain-containing protein n=1 Tax=Streptomyces sp. KL116D TaxID=3045152 RepID=UPI0035563516